MTPKPVWDYDSNSGECRAEYRGLRIRAVHDDSPSNPFEDDEGCWPIIVRSPDGYHRQSFTTYEFGNRDDGSTVDASLSFLDDAQLVHDQHAILAALGWPRHNETPTEAMKRAFETYLADDPVGYCTDADALRDLFGQLFDDNSDDNSDGEKLEQLRALYTIAGVPSYCTQVTGHSQGDWSEVLVIATKEAQAKFGTKDVKPEDLEATADLYGYWAFGDVYGYIVEAQVRPETCFACDEMLPATGAECPSCEDEVELEWEEIPDGSCWGYYGPEFDESGLEEAAIAAIDCHLRPEVATAKENTDV